MEPQTRHLVAIVGAGPAGLFAARELASQGVEVAIFNRDIKPGGLAEYGIYPEKYRMKFGLRSQFRQILEMEGVHYYGNVLIGEEGDLTLAELKALGFQAILVAAGAQATKWLGIPGEDLIGVYHAKDVVYHYNRLPPYSQREYRIGRRAAVVGVGNVMLDIVRWLISDRQIDEVIAVARRGPAEVKFDRKELEYVVANLDRNALDEEMQRIQATMIKLGQDPHSLHELVEAASQKASSPCSSTRFCVQFMASPTRILGDEQGRVKGLEVEDNTLVLERGEVKARGLGSYRQLAVDTVVFAIGDRVDDSVGLPVKGYGFVKHPEPQYPVEGESYEAYDPNTCQAIEGIFVAGWSRNASTGLVGIARKDGACGAHAILHYLAGRADEPSGDLQALQERLHGLHKAVVTRADLVRLEAAEAECARRLGAQDFKYASNQEMLAAMGLA